MIAGVSGATKVAGLFGYPARYSLSPSMHNAAYKAMQIDAVYVVFPVLPEQLAQAAASIRALDLLGVSVTIPHKETIVQYCDEFTAEASRLHAVNTISVEHGKVIGHNTDGQGFINAIREELAFDVKGKRCVVLGAGGVAKAVVGSLAGNGATHVVVINRSADRAQATALLAGDAGVVGDMSAIPEADLVVNATPIGMVGEFEGQSPIDANLISPAQYVVDLVYRPAKTQFLLDAEARGAKTAGGLGMLVHQAALQIELWTGSAPPIAAMRSAALTALEV